MSLYIDVERGAICVIDAKIKKKVVTVDITTKVLYILVVTNIITTKIKTEGGNRNENSSCLCKWKSR